MALASVESADWNDIAALAWIVTPAISSHSAMADQLFDAHGVEPAKRIEADNEAVITSLVVAGVGVALMREDTALEAAAANDVCLWRDIRAETALQFIHLRERKDDPVVHALTDVVRSVWPRPKPHTRSRASPPDASRGALGRAW